MDKLRGRIQSSSSSSLFFFHSFDHRERLMCNSAKSQTVETVWWLRSVVNRRLSPQPPLTFLRWFWRKKERSPGCSSAGAAVIDRLIDRSINRSTGWLQKNITPFICCSSLDQYRKQKRKTLPGDVEFSQVQCSKKKKKNPHSSIWWLVAVLHFPE